MLASADAAAKTHTFPLRDAESRSKKSLSPGHISTAGILWHNGGTGRLPVPILVSIRTLILGVVVPLSNSANDVEYLGIGNPGFRRVEHQLRTSLMLGFTKVLGQVPALPRGAVLDGSLRKGTNSSRTAQLAREKLNSFPESENRTSFCKVVDAQLTFVKDATGLSNRRGFWHQGWIRSESR